MHGVDFGLPEYMLLRSQLKLSNWTVCHKGIHVPHVEKEVHSASDLVMLAQDC